MFDHQRLLTSNEMGTYEGETLQLMILTCACMMNVACSPPISTNIIPTSRLGKRTEEPEAGGRL